MCSSDLQVPVYFVSEVLSASKKNYTELEKVLYVVLMASRKLRHYFQAYNIIVPSSQPLKDIMRNREATGRIGKWAAELNEFCIEYVHRSSIQSQALADFIADWTPGAQEEETPIYPLFIVKTGELRSSLSIRVTFFQMTKLITFSCRPSPLALVW